MYPGHSLDTCGISIDFPTHFRSIFNYFDILWFIFDLSTYERYHMLITQPLWPITNRIAVCFTFIPSFLPSAYHITGDWGIFTYITWPLIYYCDTLLKQWLLHSSHDIPIHFAIFIIWFRIFSSFYIYILPYLTHKKKNRGEIRSPQSSGTTATSLRLRFHCDCVLHLVLRLLAINLWPIIEFSIEFLSHRIAHLTSSHRI